MIRCAFKGGRKEMTPQSCLLTFMWPLCRVHPSHHTHSHDDDELVKFTLGVHESTPTPELTKGKHIFPVTSASTHILLTAKPDASKRRTWAALLMNELDVFKARRTISSTHRTETPEL